MKTLIVIPCMDSVPTQFCQSLAMLKKEGECAIAFQMSSLIYMARNELAMKAIKMGADYILWLDSDMVFEPDLMTRLFKTLEEKSADFVSGLYFKRFPPYEPVAYSTFDIVDDEIKAEKMTDVPKEITSVGGVGFGCVLMSTAMAMAVFDEYNTMFAPIGNVGEDIAFCYRAKTLGYEILLDPSIRCGHVGHYVVTEDLFNAMRGQHGNS